jgi:hypothetical protein
VVADGTTPIEISITVTTTSRSLTLPSDRQLPPDGFIPLVLAVLMAWVFLRAATRLRRNPRWASVGAVLLVLLAVSCGGGGGGNFVPRPPSIPTGGTPAGSYSLNVTAASGNMQSSIQLTLNVN